MKNKGIVVKARDTRISLERAQVMCKIVRKYLCHLTMKEMSEYCGVSVQAISSWESGRANNINYLFFYYDIILDDEWKKVFIDVIFNASGKKVDLTIYVCEKPTCYQTRLRCNIRVCEHGEKPIFNFTIVNEGIGV